MRSVSEVRSLAGRVGECAEPLDDIETGLLGGMLDRLRGARVVLLGEATHGTSEFYRMRARITWELIARGACTIVAVEADWPDAARIDRYVRHLRRDRRGGAARDGRAPRRSRDLSLRALTRPRRGVYLPPAARAAKSDAVSVPVRSRRARRR